MVRNPISSLLRLAPGGLALAVALSGAAAHAAQGAVHVVAPGQPGAYGDVQAAVDAAVSGDVILVRTPTTSSFVVDGKALHILGDLPVAPVCAAPSSGDNTMDDGSAHNVVRNLAPGQVTVVRGLELAGLEIADVQGAVWIEDCTIQRFAPAMRATACSRLVITGAAIEGPDGSADAGGTDVVHAGRALELAHCRAVIRDSTLRGGDGQSYAVTLLGDLPNGPGREALHVTGGSLWMSGGALAGGDGGTGGVDALGACTDGGAGATALRLEAGEPLVTLQGTTLAGGEGGPAGCLDAPTAPGQDGPPSSTSSGQIKHSLQRVSHLHVTGSGGTPAIREHESLQLLVECQPGDAVLLLLAGSPGITMPAHFVGPLLVGTPLQLLWLGTSGSSHELAFSIGAPALGSRLQKVELFLQAVIVPKARPGIGGGAASVVLLDASL
jgi:hypothetical protein